MLRRGWGSLHHHCDADIDDPGSIANVAPDIIDCQHASVVLSPSRVFNLQQIGWQRRNNPAFEGPMARRNPGGTRTDDMEVVAAPI